MMHSSKNKLISPMGGVMVMLLDYHADDPGSNLTHGMVRKYDSLMTGNAVKQTSGIFVFRWFIMNFY